MDAPRNNEANTTFINNPGKSLHTAVTDSGKIPFTQKESSETNMLTSFPRTCGPRIKAKKPPIIEDGKNKFCNHETRIRTHFPNSKKAATYKKANPTWFAVILKTPFFTFYCYCFSRDNGFQNVLPNKTDICLLPLELYFDTRVSICPSNKTASFSLRIYHLTDQNYKVIFLCGTIHFPGYSYTLAYNHQLLNSHIFTCYNIQNMVFNFFSFLFIE